MYATASERKYNRFDEVVPRGPVQRAQGGRTAGEFARMVYKGNGLSAVPPGGTAAPSSFALDGGEESELVGFYLNGEAGQPLSVPSFPATGRCPRPFFRRGGAEFSDGVRVQTGDTFELHARVLRQAVPTESVRVRLL